ncbi:Uncharacterised protein (plasmid) [Tsukamurella tyrosinosolvens]|uniref:Conjugative transposon protein TcpC n=1 Tax=Tsukamurella tyrosinosolvens TaxID=57704 RepID=A0A1H4VUS9_TSUTY|nr:conjugal transfer protein [Tsukamurella tyrosinosolvens]KXO90608.1 hypothetical protein AXK58_22830 [Tsukamurella tyrosinosolvens]SEC84034.1 hypothetical protein SAMN04489793_3325 [Tsukamurella tyrosinosolvens]VEH90320.1 Uncharacterised protein [Tsukamurella tyrosinosolvens]
MASVLKMLKFSEWKRSTLNRAMLYSAIAWPFAIVLSIFSVLLSYGAISKVPKAIDVNRAYSNIVAAQNFAYDSLLLWMAGTTSSEKRLMQRSSAGPNITLSQVPFEVRDIRPAAVVPYKGSDADEWQIVFAVTFVPPGSSSAQTNNYQVTLLDARDQNFQLLLWPVIVNPASKPFKVDSKYGDPVDKNGPLGKSLTRFATAYLASPDSSPTLGQYVSNGFGAPIASSPYTSVELLEVRAERGSPQLSSATEGTTLHVMARVKAMASLQTWSIMDLPLTVQLRGNDVWVVDKIDSPIGWGSITYSK